MTRKTEKRMRLCLGLIVCNLVFIWGNSLLPGSVSGAISDWVKDILSFIFHLGNDGPEEGGGFLRKLAHFTEFASLGLLLSWLFAMLKKTPGLPLLCGFLAACLDETIQRFVPGRGPSIKDVCIDTAGALLGVVIFLLGLKIYHKYHRRKQLEDTKL